jgi:hypothetical protein
MGVALLNIINCYLTIIEAIQNVWRFGDNVSNVV